jgi:hypothetical protein
MAKKEIFTCDACGKDMPEDGPVLVIQNYSDGYPEKGWDLCEECEGKILDFINSLGEK